MLPHIRLSPLSAAGGPGDLPDALPPRSSLLLRHALSTLYARRHLRPVWKPRGARQPARWEQPSWRSQDVLALPGQAAACLLAPLHPARPWDVVFWKQMAGLEVGESSTQAVARLTGTASLWSNSAVPPSLAPLDKLSEERSGPTGLDVVLQAAHLDDPAETWAALEVSTLAWAYPWGRASWFHPKHGLGLFAAAPMTDSFRGLTAVERAVLAEELLLGGRVSSPTLHAGLQLLPLPGLLAGWCLGTSGPWVSGWVDVDCLAGAGPIPLDPQLGGVQARLPTDRWGVETFEAKLFYVDYEKTTPLGLGPLLTNRQKQRIGTEVGLQLLDNGRCLWASCFHHLPAKRFLHHPWFEHGLELGVELGVKPFSSSSSSLVAALNIAEMWQFSQRLSVSISSLWCGERKTRSNGPE